MDAQRILDAVDEAFTRTGVATPPWPNPRSWGQDPLEEEYSRCEDPGKYRILRARGEAWADALTGLGLAAAERGGEGTWPDCPDGEPERVVRVRPSAESALPLVLGFRAVEDEPDVSVTIGAGDPAVAVRTLPDCGCDACDSGSDDLLEEFDDYVSAIVGGDLVQLSGERGSAVATGRGASASGTLARRGYVELLERVRRGEKVPAGLRAVHGARWW
ncbi:hypothetical protein H181DRAFT_04983 [Streptomyces sp. WMMB 714]|uniref:DUF6226 family protein n=1 Tax=Streptomyces sp. WMMB 714 TaxID=1286822 RepID=UPI000698389B|nr:DUF6226 family protein [Streptomyces sp. WMMB 714]SCK54414.1 hypothetical protein H181DRAFT_04983 [Streptomyces sp. WMMB 714]